MGIEITQRLWGHHEDTAIYLFKLEHASGAYVELSNYGATLVSVVVPDQSGQLAHVVLGFDHLQAYLDDQCYLGASIGRFANRIGGATFVLDNKRFFLEANEAGNSNHSGKSGYHAKAFGYRIDGNNLMFTLFSPDGEGGFPGNLVLTITYRWTAGNRLEMRYGAFCDQDTLANFTNHAYFNLSGKKETVLDHRLTLYASRVLETNAEYIPTGKITAAGNSSFINGCIADQIRANGDAGFNHYYILEPVPDQKAGALQLAAVLDHETSGRRLNVYTSYPGLVLYTGDYLQSSYPGKLLAPYQAYDGLCLECQLYPDSPNHHFVPTAVLMAGECYDQKIVYEFTLLAKQQHDVTPENF